MSGKDQSLTLVEHLAELRNRIMITMVFLVIGVVLGFVFAKEIIAFLTRDMAELHVFRPMDTVRVYMQIAVYVGIVAALPMGLYQAWAFVKPALTKVEQQNTIWFIPAAVVLFVVGACFAYFGIFPFMWEFMMTITMGLGDVNATIGLQEYIGFIVNLVLPVGLLFELPIVVIFLTKLRIVNPPRLRKLRKMAYFVFVLVAVMITPPDFISPILVYLPLISLYEISILLSARIYKRQLAAEAAFDAEYADEEDAEQKVEEAEEKVKEAETDEQEPTTKSTEEK